MAEIKSSIELAMERTRDLVASRDEGTQMTRREQRDRVLPLVRRFIRGELDPPALLAALGLLEQGHAAVAWRQVAAQECARALVPGDNHALVLPVLTALGSALAVPVEERVMQVLNEMETGRREAATRLVGVFAEMGIAGSAVVPNPESDPAWKEAHEQLQTDFSIWRDGLLNQVD